MSLEHQSLADRIALQLLRRTYADLVQMANDERKADAFLERAGIELRGPPHVSLMIGRAGRIRKKVCVEITVTDGPCGLRKPGCVYFEKFASGKLVVYGFQPLRFGE